MDRQAVRQVFEQIAASLAIKGDNPFKIRAFENAGRTLAEYPGDLEEAVRTGELANVEGIGKGTLQVARELASTGRSSFLDELREQVPPGLVEMLRVPGLGVSKVRPRFGMFSFAEKAEYLAFLWGSVVMVVSGFLLWFENFTLRNFPKWVADAATAIHFYEAILASLAILIWHFYMTIFDPDVYPMDKAWWNGKASADHLKHSRPEYYLEIRERMQKAEEAKEEAAKHPEEDEQPPTSSDDIGGEG